jgi:hypothetical protein
VAYDLCHPLLKPTALFLISRVLYRRQISLHLTRLVTIHLL